MLFSLLQYTPHGEERAAEGEGKRPEFIQKGEAGE